jgi:hypothetical protein
VDWALREGLRGLPGGSSLYRLLARARGVPKRTTRPPLTEAQVLAWADAFHGRWDHWPHRASGPVPDAPGETWRNVDAALREGLRGLAGGSSLAQLLQARRGVLPRPNRQPLTEAQVLAWASAFHARTGAWPVQGSGPILEAPGETWRKVDWALREGLRGLPGGSSLYRLLARARGVANRATRPPLRARQVLAWARAHRLRTGRWPTNLSGPIAEAPGETWQAVHRALVEGRRGFPGGSSLARLLHGVRGGKGGKG